MGVEIFLYAIPSDSSVLGDILSGELDGWLLQSIGHLIDEIRDGECGEEQLDEFSENSQPDQIEAMKSVYRSIQASPHMLSICFDGCSRGHDHWAYLFELAASNPGEIEQAKAAVFGSDAVGDSAVGGQGIPIKWSNAAQVSQISEFLKSVDFTDLAKKFEGFPSDREFYKQRPDDALQWCLQEMASIRRFYTLAARYQMAAVCVLD